MRAIRSTVFLFFLLLFIAMLLISIMSGVIVIAAPDGAISSLDRFIVLSLCLISGSAAYALYNILTDKEMWR